MNISHCQYSSKVCHITAVAITAGCILRYLGILLAIVRSHAGRVWDDGYHHAAMIS